MDTRRPHTKFMGSTGVVKQPPNHKKHGAVIQAEFLHETEQWDKVVFHVDEMMERDEYERDGRVITKEQADKALAEITEWEAEA